jgi:hypothetical protein
MSNVWIIVSIVAASFFTYYHEVIQLSLYYATNTKLTYCFLDSLLTTVSKQLSH